MTGNARTGIRVAMVIAAILAIWAYGLHEYEAGQNAERVIWQAKDAARNEAEKKLILEHQSAIQKLKDEQDQLNVKVANDHETALSQLRKNAAASSARLSAAGGLRVSRAICDGLAPGTQAGSDREHDAYLARTVQLPESIDRNLQSEADRADEIVEQARECQNWVRAHGFYGKAAP